MTAEQILAGMAAVYAGCRSYRDTGVVRTRFLARPGLPESEEERPFGTAFVRPDRFRFHFARTHAGRTQAGRYILQSSGGTVRTRTARAGEPNRARRALWERHVAEQPGATVREWRGELGIYEEYESLALGVAAFTGISGGASVRATALLLPGQVGRQRLAGLTELVRLDDADFDGAECYRLRGRPPAPSGPQVEATRQVFREMTGMEPPTEFEPVVLWIDRRTLLLRRIEDRHRLPFGESVQVTTYEPEVDVPIPDEGLAFDPPAGSPPLSPPGA
jgi:hypothetical protein